MDERKDHYDGECPVTTERGMVQVDRLNLVAGEVLLKSPMNIVEG